MTTSITIDSTQTSRRRLVVCMAWLFVLFVAAAPLHAHHLPPGMEDVDEFEDVAAFMAGLPHPFTGFDHWAFAGILGLIVYISARVRTAAITALIACAVVGGSAGLSGMPFPLPQFSLLIAAAAFGSMIFLKDKMPMALQTCLVCLSVLSQSNEHARAWPLDSGGFTYMTGVISSTALIAVAASFLAAWAMRLKNSTRFAAGSRTPVTSH